MEFVYRFPVVKGIQATREYYIAMVPLKMLGKLFPFDENEFVQPEYRAQRKLNEKRIPVISKYIIDNRDSYVFSALAASIDGDFRFIPNKENIDTGILEVSMDANFLINDGQHRKAAILEALKEDNSMRNETISIVFYNDQGLKRSQQIFTDLNKNAVKTSNSISELYDSRDVLAVMTRNVISKIDFLNTYTDKEKDILGKYSSKLFTLNTFYTANKTIVGRNKDEIEKFLFDFWMSVTTHMKIWEELQNHEITKIDLRENYIASQSVLIQAFGRIGNYCYINKINPEKYIKNIEKINWSRTSKQWYMRAIDSKGRIITNKKSAMLIANVIKRNVGLDLSEDEINAENILNEKIEK